MSGDSQNVKGGMMAVGLSKQEARDALNAYKGRLVIAAINSGSSLTVAGDLDAILELQETLKKRSVFARQLRVAQAFHSHHMVPLAPGYERALEEYGLETKPPRVPMFSSVTARPANWKSMGPAYWAKNMTSAVRYSDALTGILLGESDEHMLDVLLEVGPHPALKAPSDQVMTVLKAEIPYFGTLNRSLPDYEALLSCAGQLFAHGYDVDLVAANSLTSLAEDYSLVISDTGARIRDMPSYTWDHNKFWAETRVTRNHRQRKHRHTLLGTSIPTSVDSYPRWRNYLRKKEIPWLDDHRIEGKVIFVSTKLLQYAYFSLIEICATHLIACSRLHCYGD